MTEKTIALNWLGSFQICVRDMDYERGRTLFDPSVTAYGSLAGNLEGLDELEDRQWRRVWPHIRDFTFEQDKMRVEGSAPSGFLALALPWRSLGVWAGQAAFERPGRASLVLRCGEDGVWRCVHSHYSLLPLSGARP